MTNEALVSVIFALIAAHYLSIVYEIRKVRTDVDSLRKDVAAAATAAALASASAASAAAAATVAAATIMKDKSKR